MTPAEAKEMLKTQLASHGQDITLRRYTAASGTPRPSDDLPVRAFVRAVKAEEIVGRIDSTFSNVAFDPEDAGALWPVRKDDKVMIDGKTRNVEVVKPITLAGVLVRCDLVVAG